MKLEQRLAELTKQLASARRDGDEALVEELEDRIDEVEYELEEEYNNAHGQEWDG